MGGIKEMPKPQNFIVKKLFGEKAEPQRYHIKENTESNIDWNEIFLRNRNLEFRLVDERQTGSE